jgi:hypothetical protein
MTRAEAEILARRLSRHAMRKGGPVLEGEALVDGLMTLPRPDMDLERDDLLTAWCDGELVLVVEG